MELYFIYLVLAETLIMGSEELLVYPLLVGYVLVGKLKVMMTENLDYNLGGELVPGMVSVSVKMLKVD